MELRGRTLSVGASGSLVEQLHDALARLDHPVDMAERAAVRFGDSTAAAVRAYQQHAGLPATGTVDAATAAQLGDDLGDQGDTVVVHGRVLRADGAPAAGREVHVAAVMLSGEETLGEGRTDERGMYEIAVPARPDAGLVVTLPGDDGRAEVTAPTIYHPHPRELVDLTLGGTPGDDPGAGTELGQLLGAVYTRLSARGVARVEGIAASPRASLRGPAQWSATERAYLAGTARLDRDAVDRLTAAHRVAEQLDVAVDAVYALCAAVPHADLSAMAALTGDQVAGIVAGAVAANRVPDHAADQVEALTRALDRAEIGQPTFLADPAVSYQPTLHADALSAEQLSYLDARLNARLADEVVTRVGAVSPNMQRAVQAAVVDIDHRAYALRDVHDVVLDVLDGLRSDQRLAAEAADVADRVGDRPAAYVADVLHLDAAVRDHPLLAAEWTRGRAAHVASFAGLDPAASRAVLSSAATLFTDPDTSIEAAVAANTITDDQRAKLRHTVELSMLTDHNPALIQRILDRGGTSIRDLVGLGDADWAALLKDVPLPPGETAQSYPQRMAANIERAHPTAALMHAVTRTVAAHDEPTLRIAASDLAGAGRIAAVRDFWQANPDLDLRFTNLTEPGNDLRWDAVAEADRPHVRRAIQSYQRVLTLADTTPDRVTLLGKGFDSAVSIASTTEEAFVAASGLPADTARVTYAAAHTTAMDVAHSFMGVRDALRGGFSNLAVGNITPEVVNDLRRIDGLADLFGSQDFCDCDDCHSVLSPAAYFVDLMWFAEQHVSRRYFVNPQRTTHPLYLRTRRPDLWTLRLTCENTSTLIPYLTIVNEVLEEFLDPIAGGDIYARLADPAEKSSFGVPISVPLAELGTYLGHFQLTLADVHRILAGPEATRRRTRLGLSTQLLGVIATPDPAGAVTRIGGLTGTTMPMVDFLAHTGLARGDVDALRALRFLPALAAMTIGHQTLPDELQNFPEVLQNITADRLDVLHRFVRLRRATPWTLAELDLVLLALAGAGTATAGTIDEVTVLAVGELVDLQQRLGLTVEEACVLVDDLPVSSAFPKPPGAASGKLAYERLFDLAKLFGEANPATHEINATTTFHHYSLNTLDPTDKAIDPKTPLLLGAIGISETELLLLMGLLRDDMPFDPSGNCTLDRRRLSLLYRHARLARALSLSVADLVSALSMVFATGPTTVTTLAQIDQLASFRAWLKASPFTVSELRLILRGEESAAMRFRTDPVAVASLVADLQSSTPDPVARPAALAARLAAYVEVGQPELADLLGWTGGALTAPAITTALAATFTNGVPDTPAALDPLVAQMRLLERVALLVSNLKLDAAAVAWLSANTPALGIADRTALTLADVRALTTFRTVSALHTGAVTVPVVLGHYQAGGAFTADDRRLLADLWHADASLIDSVVDAFPLAGTAIAALSQVADRLGLCTTLGINGYSLKIMIDDSTYAATRAAAEVALGGFSAKYADEAVRRTTLEPYLDRINVIKRDSLCDYIIAHQQTLKFRTHAEIYAYFLLDVDMSGCFRISRLVAAISSVQLYIQRCLLNLEQSDPALNPGIVDVHVPASAIPAVEWEWRRNYRVWEANRKVFLYPESYLEPELRDDKTPLFKELEEGLLAKKVTKEAAEDAYEAYLTGFNEVGHLLIGGSCYDAASSTYHFFGHTTQDPPTWFHRSWIAETTWTPWRKIDLAIEAPYISAQVYLGKLYIFWVNGRYKDHTTIVGGESKTAWWDVTVGLSYSRLTEKGTWTPPQKLPWLYPSQRETITATERIFHEDDLHWMETSKQYLKVFPAVVGGQITLRYYNYQLNQYASFDRRLDLFHNRLVGGPVTPKLPAAQAVALYAAPGGTAQLGVQSSSYDSEAYFDRVIDSVTNIVTAHSYVTKPFPLTSYKKGDPGAVWPIHSVNSGYPDTTFAFGDQVYLIHGGRPATGPNFRDRLFKDVRVADSALTGPRLATSPMLHSLLLDASIPPAGPTFVRLPSSTTLSSALTHGHILVPSGHVNPPTGIPFPAGTGTSDGVSSPVRPTPVTGGLVAAPIGRLPIGKLLTPAYITPYFIVSKRRMIRLTTSLTDDLGEILLARGLDGFFSLATQSKTEKPVGITFTDRAALGPPLDDPHHVDLRGAHGIYYSELFFHIPFLVAAHCNAEQKFEEAAAWYARVFDPTAPESSADTVKTDRVWRYVGFRGLTVPTLKAILTDQAAIAAYRNDPFNPHAIARLRPSAYQKTIVMHSIDNWLDWGDSLFAQDTIESINEATQLYLLAQSVLGPRPVKHGTCATAPEADLTYEKIGPNIAKGSEFLVTLENWTLSNQVASGLRSSVLSATASGVQAATVAHAPHSLLIDPNIPPATVTPAPSGTIAPLTDSLLFAKAKSKVLVAEHRSFVAHLDDRASITAIVGEQSPAAPVLAPPAPNFGFHLVAHSALVFCVPPNEVLLGYWDRVDDRLYKIRNCMNISGVRRSLALFQPPIDPMALVRARAAGLGLEDVLAAMAAPIAPYRFTHLLERARAMAQTVQTFGTTLLQALERKDVEQLTLLRSVQERTVLRETKSIKTTFVQETQHHLQALEDAKAYVQLRIDHLQGLLDDGRNFWEITHQDARQVALLAHEAGAAVQLIASILHLIPQVGSPFAMKFGGMELGSSNKNAADWVRTLGYVSEHVSISAGIEAVYQRRTQEWTHLLGLARQELRQTEQNRLAAHLRASIAQADLDLHATIMEQADELNEFHRAKFTGLGLYNYLATTLTRVYREAYHTAYELAGAAQRAYAYERDDDTVFVAADNWAYDRAGLLAGERLLGQLDQLERSYLMTNNRRYEVTQSFSLAQLDPAALVTLRETGSAVISIPEFAYDLVYPGQYRRRITAVRLTIPCVVGPYTNVGAKLTLTASKVRMEPGTDPGGLVAVPPQATMSIATSTAQYDAGMFDLNFRDERYLPFEGAGAVSDWSLQLPTALRPFDYRSIADVVLHVSYTALDDGALRDTVEGAIGDTLAGIAASTGLFRLFSLRHNFPAAATQLLTSSAAMPQTSLELTPSHFPYLLRGKTLTTTGMSLYVLPRDLSTPVDVTGLTLTVDGVATSGFTLVPETTVQHAEIAVSGPALKAHPLTVTAGALDADTIEDVLVLVKYSVS